MEYLLRYLQGRNASGASADAGIRIHVLMFTDNRTTNGTIARVYNRTSKALCGAKPGRLSGGWSEPWEDNAEVSCPRCAKKLEKIKAATPLHQCLGCTTLVIEGDWCNGCHKKGAMSIEAAIVSTNRSLHPEPKQPLPKEPPDNPFLKMLWEAAQELE